MVWDARHIAVAPNGDIYVALQGGQGTAGGVVALRDANGDGRFEIQEKFGDGSITGIALATVISTSRSRSLSSDTK